MDRPFVRLARPDDIQRLPAIGRAADQLFLDSPHPVIASFPPDMPEEFAAAQDDWKLWVPVDRDDRPVGFLRLIELAADMLHVAQFAVDPAHGRRGYGRRTVETAVRFHAPRGYRRLSLTTFVDVAWNAPYYARLGFEPLTIAATPAPLERRRRLEAGQVLPLDRRVAMVREMSGGGTT